MSNPSKRGIEKRLAKARSTSFTDVPKGCPRVIIIPMLEPYDNKDGRRTVQVVGFAAFWLDEVTGQGNKSYINGYFLERVEAVSYTHLASIPFNAGMLISIRIISGFSFWANSTASSPLAASPTMVNSSPASIFNIFLSPSLIRAWSSAINIRILFIGNHHPIPFHDSF